MDIEPRLSVAQLAELWGCSRQHVYSLIEQGHLRAVRIGSLIRLRPDDVREYETRQCLVQKPGDRNFPRAQKTPLRLTVVGGWSARRISCRTEIASEARRFSSGIHCWRETPPPPSPTVGQIMDGYLLDREPKVHSDSISYDCATLKAYLGDLPADLLNIEQVRAYIQARRKKGARRRGSRLPDEAAGTFGRDFDPRAGTLSGRARMGRQAEMDRGSAPTLSARRRRRLVTDGLRGKS